MKVGIITIFDNENLGNKLQNYAMHQVLSRYAEAVVTLRNKPQFHTLGEFLRRGTPLAESVWLNVLLGKKRKAKLLQFHKTHIPTSRYGYCCGKTYQKLKPSDRCDRYCIGSDQVWNPELGRTGGFSYGSFGAGNVFSYAASFGLEEMPEKYRGEIANWLRKLTHISLREEAGVEIVKGLRGREAQVTIDPTLLLPVEIWEALAKKPWNALPQRYLLLYFLGPISPETSARILERAGDLGLDIINLMDSGSPFYEIGPEEFLFLLHNAALVYTDSFHAGVFSFLFRRPMVLFQRPGNMGSRIDTFTKTFCLENCRMRGRTIPEVSLAQTYGDGFAILETEQKRAWAYLDGVFAEEKVGT